MRQLKIVMGHLKAVLKFIQIEKKHTPVSPITIHGKEATEGHRGMAGRQW